MADYIKREDAINAIRSAFTGMTADTMELRVNSIPSADVAPVRHGRWINTQYPFSKCNQCGAYMDTAGNEANFCCVCGAKMDGDDNAE